MSLNANEREATRKELGQNLLMSGLDSEMLASRLGRPEQDVQDALNVNGTDPGLVWAVRDALVNQIEADGGEPVPFTVLTDDARQAANGWFGVPLTR